MNRAYVAASDMDNTVEAERAGNIEYCNYLDLDLDLDSINPESPKSKSKSSQVMNARPALFQFR